MIDKLRIGVITSPHGVKGEAKVYPTTDDLTRFDILDSVYLVSDKINKKVKLISSRKNKNMLICKFEGINTPEDVKEYRNTDIFMDRCDAPKLKENENYVADLIGLKVIDEDNNEIGIVKDLFETGANYVMEVSLTDGKNVLFPYIKECILDVNIDEGFILVHIMDGLMDI